MNERLGRKLWAWSAPNVVAAVGVVLGLVLLDVVDLSAIAPRVPLGVAGVLAFVAVGLGLGGTIALCAALARTAIVGFTPGGERVGRACLGVFDGVVVFALAVGLRVPPSGQTVTRGVALAAAIAIGVVIHAEVAKRPKVGHVMTAVVLVATAVLMRSFLRSFQDGPRLAAHFVILVAALHLTRPILQRAPLRPLAIAALSLVVLSAAIAGPLVTAIPSVRQTLYLRSVHVRDWVLLATSFADRDDDRAVAFLGGDDCAPADGAVFPGAGERAGDGIDQNCSGGDGSVAPAALTARAGYGAAAGSDVVLLSLDGVRWDLAGELVQTRRALGPAAEMTFAVAPAPRTLHSLAAMQRGRAFREVRFERVEALNREAPANDSAPTLAATLTRAGYRAITAPTHAYLEEGTGITAGFESIPTVALARGPRRTRLIGSNRPIVRAKAALRVLERAVARTHGPLLVWAHLMDTHEPYCWDAPDGCAPGREPLRAAIRDVDARLAAFLDRFAKARGRRPVVAIFADHGEELGEHGARFHSSSVYAEQTRVPLLLAAPGVPPGRYGSPVSIASIPATVLDLLGVRTPPTMTEASLLPPLHGEGPWPALAVSEVRFARHSMVGYSAPGWRLLVDPVHDVVQLFDAERDPLEQHDLSEKKPDVVARLLRLARAWDETH